MWECPHSIMKNPQSALLRVVEATDSVLILLYSMSFLNKKVKEINNDAG